MQKTTKIFLLFIFSLAGFLLAGCALPVQRSAAPAGQAQGGSAMVSSGEGLVNGAGIFTMPEPTGANSRDISVFYYKPASWTPEDKVIFVMTGVGRNAATYRDEWIKAADAHHFLIVCPEFTDAKYPGAHYYILGNVTEAAQDNGERSSSAELKLNPQEQWTYPVIDRVASRVRQLTGAKGKFVLYGHSAGAQFVERYLLLSDKGTFSQFILAQAGWYTLPDLKTTWPYGVKGVPVDEERIKTLLGQSVYVLLGSNDTASADGILRHNRETDRQGKNRLDRGQYFFGRARKLAGQVKTPFKWSLTVIPGAGHSNRQMVDTAAEIAGAGE